MEEIESKWQALFAQAFADFPDDRILEEARRTLAAMDYRLEWDDDLIVEIPPDVLLLVVRRSLHHDGDARLGGYFSFDIAVGPYLTAQGLFSGASEYGLLRLEFGLDGSYQDEYFDLSPLQLSGEESRERELAAIQLDVNPE